MCYEGSDVEEPRCQSPDVGHQAKYKHRPDASEPQCHPVHLQRQTDLGADYWLIVEPRKEVDLCLVDPGFDVDLYVSTDLQSMTEIWLGFKTIDQASDDGR